MMPDDKFYKVPQIPDKIQNEDVEGVAVSVDESKEENQETFDINDYDPLLCPRIKLKKLELVNFGKYEDAVIDFTHNGKVMPMSCFVGPNGTGKTTVIDAVTMLCSNYSKYDYQRFSDMMFHRVRNWMHLEDDNKIKNASFSVKGTFEAFYPVYAPPFAVSDDPSPRTIEYTVEFTRHKVRSSHPDFIQRNLPRYCFAARFDQELSLFQIQRSKWPLFQELFSSVTGFPIEEQVDMFHDTSDTRLRKLMDDYVLGFTVQKPNEIIRHKMCSAGERKIAKCFSTILNARVEPSIIVVDNVLMHIETGRHLSVMESLSKCFPNSQLIVACHSVPVSKSLPHRERLYDMRWIDIPGLIWREPWRLRLLDDVNESLERLSSIPLDLCPPETQKFVSQGASLIRIIETERDKDKVVDQTLTWLSKFPLFLKADMLATPLPKIWWHDDRQLES
jgi:ABC-type lipoprotein export system ATPase subunit